MRSGHENACQDGQEKAIISSTYSMLKNDLFQRRFPPLLLLLLLAIHFSYSPLLDHHLFSSFYHFLFVTHCHMCNGRHYCWRLMVPSCKYHNVLPHFWSYQPNLFHYIPHWQFRLRLHLLHGHSCQHFHHLNLWLHSRAQPHE